MNTITVQFSVDGENSFNINYFKNRTLLVQHIVDYFEALKKQKQKKIRIQKYKSKFFFIIIYTL